MNNGNIEFLIELEVVIRQRIAAPTEDSYTARLVASGDRRVAQKLGEEAVELALATASGNREEQLDEAADLLYHLLVLLNSKSIRLADVSARLSERHLQT
jgi:phosphoribosyl-ATP pyrophosphohydrolase/phosphoribosyl-AMP cyclohydrolase